MGRELGVKLRSCRFGSSSQRFRHTEIVNKYIFFVEKSRPPHAKGVYGRISLITYQLKSVDKMADSETLTVNSSQICTYFCKDSVTGHCLYLVKNWISNRHPFSN